MSAAFPTTSPSPPFENNFRKQKRNFSVLESIMQAPRRALQPAPIRRCTTCCERLSGTVTSCSECGEGEFCSDECRNDYWLSGHAWTCSRQRDAFVIRRNDGEQQQQLPPSGGPPGTLPKQQTPSWVFQTEECLKEFFSSLIEFSSFLRRADYSGAQSVVHSWISMEHTTTPTAAATGESVPSWRANLPPRSNSALHTALHTISKICTSTARALVQRIISSSSSQKRTVDVDPSPKTVVVQQTAVEEEEETQSQRYDDLLFLQSLHDVLVWCPPHQAYDRPWFICSLEVALTVCLSYFAYSSNVEEGENAAFYTLYESFEAFRTFGLELDDITHETPLLTMEGKRTLVRPVALLRASSFPPASVGSSTMLQEVDHVAHCVRIPAGWALSFESSPLLQWHPNATGGLPSTDDPNQKQVLQTLNVFQRAALRQFLVVLRGKTNGGRRSLNISEDGPINNAQCPLACVSIWDACCDFSFLTNCCSQEEVQTVTEREGKSVEPMMMPISVPSLRWITDTCAIRVGELLALYRAPALIPHSCAPNCDAIWRAVEGLSVPVLSVVTVSEMSLDPRKPHGPQLGMCHAFRRSNDNSSSWPTQIDFLTASSDMRWSLMDAGGVRPYLIPFVEWQLDMPKSCMVGATYRHQLRCGCSRCYVQQDDNGVGDHHHVVMEPPPPYLLPVLQNQQTTPTTTITGPVRMKLMLEQGIPIRMDPNRYEMNRGIRCSTVPCCGIRYRIVPQKNHTVTVNAPQALPPLCASTTLEQLKMHQSAACLEGQATYHKISPTVMAPPKWICWECGDDWSDAEMPLDAEDRLAQQMFATSKAIHLKLLESNSRAVGRRHTRDTAAQEKQLYEMLKKDLTSSAAVLGPAHWTYLWTCRSFWRYFVYIRNVCVGDVMKIHASKVAAEWFRRWVQTCQFQGVWHHCGVSVVCAEILSFARDVLDSVPELHSIKVKLLLLASTKLRGALLGAQSCGVVDHSEPQRSAVCSCPHLPSPFTPQALQWMLQVILPAPQMVAGVEDRTVPKNPRCLSGSEFLKFLGDIQETKMLAEVEPEDSDDGLLALWENFLVERIVEHVSANSQPKLPPSVAALFGK